MHDPSLYVSNNPIQSNQSIIIRSMYQMNHISTADQGYLDWIASCINQ